MNLRDDTDLIFKIFKLGSVRFGLYVALLVAFSSVYEVFFLYLVGVVVDGGSVEIAALDLAFDSNALIQFLMLVFVGRGALNLYSNFELFRYSIGYVAHLSNKLGLNVVSVPGKSQTSSEMTHTIYTETNQVVNNIIHPLMLIFRDILYVATITAYVVYQFQGVAIIFFGCLFVGSVFITILLLPILRAMGTTRQRLDQTRLKRTDDIARLHHQFYMTVKDDNLVNKQFNTANKEFSSVVSRYMFLRASNRTFLEIVLFFSLITVVYLNHSSEASLTEFFAVLAVAAVRALPAMTNVVSFLNGIEFHVPALRAVGRVLQVEEDQTSPGFRETSADITQVDVVVVKFARPGGNFVEHVFKRGMLNVIAGPSGVGKSTLLKSMIGESDLFAIDIVLDGRECPVYEFADLVAYCPQDVHVIDESFRSNAELFCGVGAISDEVMDIHLSSLDLRSSLTRRQHVASSTISGGQRRRLAFLRCLLLERPILICDEPTSELDGKSAETIRGILKILSSSFLVIITSHDQALVERADNILDISND
jgi:ABC-type multidrug transport system fused ATPase/permease subunit